MFALLLFVVVLSMARMWWNKTNEQKQLLATIAQTEQQTYFIQQQTDSIIQETKGLSLQLDQNVVPDNNPIPWCSEKINNLVGLFKDMDFEYVGKKPLLEMKITRASRDTMDGLGVGLARYQIRLNLKKISFSKLQYVLEQLESTESYGIIESLKVQVEEEKGEVSALILFSFPSFYHPEDREEIKALLIP